MRIIATRNDETYPEYPWFIMNRRFVRWWRCLGSWLLGFDCRPLYWFLLGNLSRFGTSLIPIVRSSWLFAPHSWPHRDRSYMAIKHPTARYLKISARATQNFTSVLMITLFNCLSLQFIMAMSFYLSGTPPIDVVPSVAIGNKAASLRVRFEFKYLRNQESDKSSARYLCVAWRTGDSILAILEVQGK